MRYNKELDESNQIIHYFSPSQFIRYIGYKYIPQQITRNQCHSMEISNKYIFSIINDLFSSMWYYNYGKVGKLNSFHLKQLFSDSNDIINWITFRVDHQ